jgi:hypothetical protein
MRRRLGGVMKMEVLMRGQALLITGAMAMAAVTFAPLPAAAQPAPYQSYSTEDQVCQKSKQDRMVAGGVLGALAGLILGSNVAAHGVKSEGSALGAVAGAVAGGAIGRSTANCGPNANRYGGQYNQYGQQYGQPGSYQGQDQDRRSDDYGLDGVAYAPTAYGGRDRNGRECGYGQQVMRDPNGRSYSQSVYMCRGDDGQWRPE